MRVASIAATVLGAALAACGTSSTTAPPPSELVLSVAVNPSAQGGLRSPSTVSALLYLDAMDPAVVEGAMESAEFTVFDAQGAVLAREVEPGPTRFGPDRTLTIQRVLAWTPADVLGRSLHVRIRFGGRTAFDRTVTF